jgi:hypothetical protein
MGFEVDPTIVFYFMTFEVKTTVGSNGEMVLK